MNKNDILLHCLKNYFGKGYQFAILKYVRYNPLCSQADISKALGQSEPLISYYMRGNKRSLGFIKLGLIENKRKRKKDHINLYQLTKAGEWVYNILIGGALK